MPMSADEFNAADPAVRSFYRNFADVNLAYIGNYYSQPLLLMQTLSPTQLAQRTRAWQQTYSSQVNINDTSLLLNDMPPPTYGPPADSFIWVTYLQQWYWVPYTYEEDVRPAAKVRKSYWTGQARRRRNR